MDPTTTRPPRLLGYYLRAATPEQRELVGTFVDPEGLHGLVRRTVKNATPGEYATVHSRIRKRRDRFVEFLREQIGDASTRARNFSEH